MTLTRYDRPVIMATMNTTHHATNGCGNQKNWLTCSNKWCKITPSNKYNNHTIKEYYHEIK